MVKWLCCFAALAAAACSQETAPAATRTAPRLELAWRAGGLADPESVALSADGAFLFVTNVNGEADVKDGNGFISRIGLDGEMLQREFARGLNAPKGVVLAGDTLYVADIDEVVSIDAATGEVRNRVPAPEAQFLNDIARTPDGRLLAADSGAGRIYVVGADGADVWLEHRLLQSVNGLLPEAQRLVVTTMAGRLLAIDYETRQITVLAEDLGDADGIAPLEGGRYLVSEWPGVMHVVEPDGARQTILDTREEGRLLNDFLLVGDVLYQPHWEPGELSAYRVVQSD